MSTAEKIKISLECCLSGNCKDCPYRELYGVFLCKTERTKDTLAYIQQLEDRNNAMYHTILGVMHFVDKWLDVPAYDPDKDLNGTVAIGRASQAREITLQAIEQLGAERDAAVADIRLAFTSYVGACQTCKYGENQIDCIEPLRCGNCENEKCKCQSCDSYESNWEWRGPQEVTP